MIRKQPQVAAPQELGDRQSMSVPAEATVPQFTLFAIPKPFAGDAVRIQTNAIRSWTKLGPAVEVLLIGDDAGTAEAATNLGVSHVAGVETNEQGTPLLSSAFSIARQFSKAPVLIYCNCDVILMNEFVEAIAELHASDQFEQFLAIGRRLDVDVDELIEFDDQAKVQAFVSQARKTGQRGPIVCKEFFAFSRDDFAGIPEFAVGRGNWDNWMVADARRQGIPVISISEKAMVIHQKHGYEHMNASRLKCYLTGAEARENERLGHGKNLVRGSSSTWTLGRDGLRKKSLPGLNLDFWLDLPLFLRLLANLMGK